MHPACPSKKQNHLQNSLLRRTQFWVRKTFSKPASLKRASLVARPVAISHKVTRKPKHCTSATLIQKTWKHEPKDGPKNGTVKLLFFCSFTKLCMRSQKWDRQAVPFLGPCLGSFFEVFCIKVAEAQRFGFNEALWLMATGRATVPTLYACC